MEQPMEERVASLEDAAQWHEQTIARLASFTGNHDQLMEGLPANKETLHAIREKIAIQPEEMARDTVTRRLRLRLTRRYGWLGDEQNGTACP